METALYVMYGVIGVMIVLPFVLQAQVIGDLYRKWRAGELSWPSSWGGGPVGSGANTSGGSSPNVGDSVTLAKAEAAQARAEAAEARAAAAEARAEAAEAAAAAAVEDGDAQSPA